MKGEQKKEKKKEKQIMYVLVHTIHTTPGYGNIYYSGIVTG